MATLEVKPARVFNQLSFLIGAAGRGQLAKVIAIVGKKKLTAADLNGCNSSQLTPLCAACGSEDDTSAVVSYLLEVGVDVNRPGYKNRTPLMFACDSGNVAAVKLLLAAGASTSGRYEFTGGSALHIAVGGFTGRGSDSTSRLPIVTALLDSGADISALTFMSRSALHEAAAAGINSVFEVLIAGGLDVMNEAKGNVWNGTPLELAVWSCWYSDVIAPRFSATPSTCQLLLSLGKQSELVAINNVSCLSTFQRFSAQHVPQSSTVTVPHRD